MIVVDSAVWIDHFRLAEPVLETLLTRHQALMHPHVLGEIALGSIARRQTVLALLDHLPGPPVAKDEHVRAMIEQNGLSATGIGYTDAHLIASALITPGGFLWTRDKRLRAHAERLGVAYSA